MLNQRKANKKGAQSLSAFFIDADYFN